MIGSVWKKNTKVKAAVLEREVEEAVRAARSGSRRKRA
jgi:hypothetical protein